MQQYTKLAGIDLPQLAVMSDVDIACGFQAGVHADKFSTGDVRHLVEELDSHCKYRPQTRLFLNMYDFLTNKLHLGEDLAHCMAFGFKVTPIELLSWTNHEISESLDPAFLEDWLIPSDCKLILTQLRFYYPNRLQRSQSSTASSRANPYVV